MESVFLGCFLFGAMFTLVTAILGAVGSAVDMGGGVDGVELPALKGAPVVKGAPVLKGAPGTDPLPMLKGVDAAVHPIMHLLNTSSILAFLTWFGAMGYLGLKLWAWPLVLAVAAAVPTGLAGGALMAWVLAKFRAAEHYKRAEDDRLEGTLARVTVSLPENGVGEIVFTKGGATRSEAARGPRDLAIAEDSEVLVIGFENGIAQVEPWQPLLDTQTRSVPALEEGRIHHQTQPLKEE